MSNRGTTEKTDSKTQITQKQHTHQDSDLSAAVADMRLSTRKRYCLHELYVAFRQLIII